MQHKVAIIPAESQVVQFADLLAWPQFGWGGIGDALSLLRRRSRFYVCSLWAMFDRRQVGVVVLRGLWYIVAAMEIFKCKHWLEAHCAMIEDHVLQELKPITCPFNWFDVVKEVLRKLRLLEFCLRLWSALVRIPLMKKVPLGLGWSVPQRIKGTRIYDTLQFKEPLLRHITTTIARMHLFIVERTGAFAGTMMTWRMKGESNTSACARLDLRALVSKLPRSLYVWKSTPKPKEKDESKAKRQIVQMHMTRVGPIPAPANTCAPWGGLVSYATQICTTLFHTLSILFRLLLWRVLFNSGIHRGQNCCRQQDAVDPHCFYVILLLHSIPHVWSFWDLQLQSC